MGRNGSNGNGRRYESRRIVLLSLGLLLIALAPIVGALPGPGGVLVLIPGLALTLRNSKWAKRLYVRCKQRWPRLGHWTDRCLRRPSHFRRVRRNERERQAND